MPGPSKLPAVDDVIRILSDPENKDYFIDSHCGIRDSHFDMAATYPNPPLITPEQVLAVCTEAKTYLSDEKMLLSISPPAVIVGNIHGHMFDMLTWFEKAGYPPAKNYIFLGDYIDKGKYSTELLTLLLALKCKYPDEMNLIRGHHDSKRISTEYFFNVECGKRFSPACYTALMDCCNLMSAAGVLGKKIFCVHAGISPDLKEIKEINTIKKGEDVPEKGVFCDLVWSDTNKVSSGFLPNDDRGISVMYGEDEVKAFLKRNNLSLIVRSHEVLEPGFEEWADGQLVTIFSAIHYGGSSSDKNDGTIMIVRENLVPYLYRVTMSARNSIACDAATEPPAAPEPPA